MHVGDADYFFQELPRKSLLLPVEDSATELDAFPKLVISVIRFPSVALLAKGLKVGSFVATTCRNRNDVINIERFTVRLKFVATIPTLAALPFQNPQTEGIRESSSSSRFVPSKKLNELVKKLDHGWSTCPLRCLGFHSV